MNLRGVFFGMKHGLPPMLERGYGRIINTASAARPQTVALQCLLLRIEGRRGRAHGFRGTGGRHAGHHGQRRLPRPDGHPDVAPPGGEEWKRWKIESLPMKRVGQPVEIAWAYVYLASDEASYCTGQSLSPNGGDVMW